jgi:hypothetical protein
MLFDTNWPTRLADVKVHHHLAPFNQHDLSFNAFMAHRAASGAPNDETGDTRFPTPIVSPPSQYTDLAGNRLSEDELEAVAKGNGAAIGPLGFPVRLSLSTFADGTSDLQISQLSNRELELLGYSTGGGGSGGGGGKTLAQFDQELAIEREKLELEKKRLEAEIAEGKLDRAARLEEVKLQIRSNEKIANQDTAVRAAIANQATALGVRGQNIQREGNLIQGFGDQLQIAGQQDPIRSAITLLGGGGGTTPFEQSAGAFNDFLKKIAASLPDIGAGPGNVSSVPITASARKGMVGPAINENIQVHEGEIARTDSRGVLRQIVPANRARVPITRSAASGVSFADPFVDAADAAPALDPSSSQPSAAPSSEQPAVPGAPTTTVSPDGTVTIAPGPTPIATNEATRAAKTALRGTPAQRRRLLEAGIDPRTDGALKELSASENPITSDSIPITGGDVLTPGGDATPAFHEGDEVEVDEFAPVFDGEASNARLIGSPYSDEVFVVDRDGILRHIPNGTTLEQMGFRWEDIENVLPAEFNEFQIGEQLPSLAKRLVGDPNSDKVFIVNDDGTLSHIPNAHTFNFMNLRWEDIEDLTQAEWDALVGTSSDVGTHTIGDPIASLVAGAEGTLVSAPGQNEVYLIVDGERRHIPNGVTLYAMGFTFADVQEISVNALNNIALGNTLPDQTEGGGFDTMSDLLHSLLSGDQLHDVPIPEEDLFGVDLGSPVQIAGLLNNMGPVEANVLLNAMAFRLDIPVSALIEYFIQPATPGGIPISRSNTVAI